MFVADFISLGTYPSALVGGQTHVLIIGIGDAVVKEPSILWNEYRKHGSRYFYITEDRFVEFNTHVTTPELAEFCAPLGWTRCHNVTSGALNISCYVSGNLSMTNGLATVFDDIVGAITPDFNISLVPVDEEFESIATWIAGACSRHVGLRSYRRRSSSANRGRVYHFSFSTQAFWICFVDASENIMMMPIALVMPKDMALIAQVQLVAPPSASPLKPSSNLSRF